MVSINTNISSLVAQSSLRNSTSKLNNAIEQMTTGYKINHAKDNAANYSIAVDMSTKIGAYEVAEENCAMALDLVNTANEALGLIADKITRIWTLKEQYENGTFGADSKKSLNNEAFLIGKEIERIRNNTEYNGKALFCYYDPSNSDAYITPTFNFQIGIDNSNSSKITVATSNEIVDFIATAVSYNTESIKDIYLETFDFDILNQMVPIVTTKQTELGAVQNRLESALDAISTQRENLISSRSTLKDADVAEVSSEYIKHQILQQASATLLATANQSPALALQLL